jgi:hypothetical protein
MIEPPDRPDVPPDYEPPRVERVLTPAALGREILYAGRPGASDTDETDSDK